MYILSLSVFLSLKTSTHQHFVVKCTLICHFHHFIVPTLRFKTPLIRPPHLPVVKMDPFEARLQFIQILEALNPSSVTLSRAIGFALKNMEMHEDFHSVILEELDKIDINARMNVMYFIEALVHNICSQNSSRELRQRPYLANIERDFHIILQKVIPSDNLVNLNGSVNILVEVEKCYNVDDSELWRSYLSLSLGKTPEIPEEVEKGFPEAWIYLINQKKRGLEARLKLLHDKPTAQEVEENGEKPLNQDLEQLSRKQILQRMEADRERHKRHKETNWHVIRPLGKVDRAEFEKIWHQYSALDDHDLEEMRDLYQEAAESYLA